MRIYAIDLVHLFEMANFRVDYYTTGDQFRFRIETSVLAALY